MWDVTQMERLQIIVGGDMGNDLRELAKNPKKAKGHTSRYRLYVRDLSELQSALSPKRLELLYELLTYYPEGCPVGKAARKLGRKQEAVSRDGSRLSTLQLLEKDKQGRKVYLKPKFDKIEIRFAGAK